MLICHPETFFGEVQFSCSVVSNFFFLVKHLVKSLPIFKIVFLLLSSESFFFFNILDVYSSFDAIYKFLTQSFHSLDSVGFFGKDFLESLF